MRKIRLLSQKICQSGEFPAGDEVDGPASAHGPQRLADLSVRLIVGSNRQVQCQIVL